MKKLIFAMAVAAAGAASAVSFSYQGALKTAEGGPIPAGESNKTITFRLYDNPTSGTVLWGRQYAVHLDTNGLFNVELSDTTGSQSTTPKPLTNDLAWVLSEYPGKEKDLYIALDVQGSAGEIRPRQKLLNVPSAGFAADVATARGDFSVSGTATIEGLVTAKNGLTVENGRADLRGGLTVSSANLSITGGGGIIPKGGIIMWSGSTIPQGWVLCDGDNDTPNLSGRFIVGYDPKNADYNKVGKSGGAASVTLISGQTPLREHSHIYWANRDQKVFSVNYPAHGERRDGYHKSVCRIPDAGKTELEDGFKYDTTIDGDNSAQAHENRPPYYVLCFIMKQ